MAEPLSSVHVRLAWEEQEKIYRPEEKRVRERERLKMRVKKRRRGRQKRGEGVKS